MEVCMASEFTIGWSFFRLLWNSNTEVKIISTVLGSRFSRTCGFQTVQWLSTLEFSGALESQENLDEFKGIRRRCLTMWFKACWGWDWARKNSFHFSWIEFQIKKSNVHSSVVGSRILDTVTNTLDLIQDCHQRLLS